MMQRACIHVHCAMFHLRDQSMYSSGAWQSVPLDESHARRMPRSGGEVIFKESQDTLSLVL